MAPYASFCEEQFEQRSASHQFCSPSCREWFNKTHRTMSEMMLLDMLLLDAHHYHHGFAYCVNNVDRMLGGTDCSSCVSAWAFRTILNAIEEHGANFKARDLKAMEEAAATCEQLARRAARWAARLRQGRQRADVLAKTKRAMDSQDNVIPLERSA
jgi:hypothetical protein